MSRAAAAQVTSRNRLDTKAFMVVLLFLAALRLSALFCLAVPAAAWAAFLVLYSSRTLLKCQATSPKFFRRPVPRSYPPETASGGLIAPLAGRWSGPGRKRFEWVRASLKPRRRAGLGPLRAHTLEFRPLFCSLRYPRQPMKNAVNVAITGAAGQIGYALAFRVAAGALFGRDTTVNLHLLEITAALPALRGVVMELDDCAFSTLGKVLATDDARVAFADCHAALLVGARPRGPGMERKDLLQANAQIFSAQGKALNEVAAREVRVLVVGNPANTNALISCHNAPAL